MKLIAAVVRGEISGLVVRIVRGFVLIDDRIAAAGFAPNESIDLFSRPLSRLSPVLCSLVWSQGRTEKLDVFLVSPGYQTLHPCDQLFACRRGFRRSEVVDRLVGKDYPADTPLPQNVAVEPGLRTSPSTGGEETIPADPLIEHADV